MESTKPAASPVRNSSGSCQCAGIPGSSLATAKESFVQRAALRAHHRAGLDVVPFLPALRKFEHELDVAGPGGHADFVAGDELDEFLNHAVRADVSRSEWDGAVAHVKVARRGVLENEKHRLVLKHIRAKHHAGGDLNRLRGEFSDQLLITKPD